MLSRIWLCHRMHKQNSNVLGVWCSLYRCYVAVLLVVVVVVVGGHLVAAGWSLAHLTRAATCRPPASQRATIGCLNPLPRRSLGERERWSLRSSRVG